MVRMATVNELKEFMSKYIEIHGQNNNLELLDNKMHLKCLDEFIGKTAKELKIQYKLKYERYEQIKLELKQNYGDDKERERKLDLLKYQIDEIEQAKLKETEEIELEEKRKIMINAEKITENLKIADSLLSENGVDTFSTAIKALEKIETIDEKYEKAVNSLKSMYYELQELSRDLSSYGEEIYFDEQERNETEQRLDLIYSLKRKYGNTIEEIIKYKEEIKKEVEHIENLEQYNEKLNKELNLIEAEMTDIAQKLNKIRTEYAKLLSQNINKELSDLEMKNAKINIHVCYNEKEFYTNGKDNVDFYISTNIGEDEKELNKIASGGEISRIMLAIKKVLADTDKTPVLIFDEIDTGISGNAANMVAEKLNNIAKNHQVLCISHLPSIAAMADNNYFISKKVEKERTNTSIKLLNEDEIIKEIARISSGQINEVTIKYAKELRNKKVHKKHNKRNKLLKLAQNRNN